MNRLMIIGNLVRDPELRVTSNGTNVCSFSVAVNRRGQKGSEQQTDYFNVSAWRELGENCAKYLAKGRKVCVVGEVGVRIYQTQNGETRANMEVQAREVEFLSSRNEAESAQPTFTPVSPADLPFD